MVLTNEFQVNAPLARAWRLFEELESVVPCMPGASYAGQEGDTSKVGIKIKVGAILADFRGTVRILERQEATHTVVIQGSGKDLGGKGQAAATIHVALQPVSPGSTRVQVKTDLGITGRLAQFGGGTIADIAARVIQQFTANLNERLAAEQPSAIPGVAAPEQTAQTEKNAPSPTPQGAEPLDVGAMVGAMALAGVRRHALVAIVALIAGVLLGRLL